MIRKADKIWRLIKYEGDLAIYARCKCKFEYSCGSKGITNSLQQKSYYFYPYCPFCGSKKKYYTKEIINGGSIIEKDNKIKP